MTGQLRNAEIENLHATFAGNENVLGLQVAMDDSLFVCRRESLYDLLCPVERLPYRHGSAKQLLAERFTFQVFHDQEIGVSLFAYVMEDADVGVLQ